jgi:hypothetical protein
MPSCDSRRLTLIGMSVRAGVQGGWMLFTRGCGFPAGAGQVLCKRVRSA